MQVAACQLAQRNPPPEEYLAMAWGPGMVTCWLIPFGIGDTKLIGKQPMAAADLRVLEQNFQRLTFCVQLK